jgi:hypothetical protein
MPADRGRVKPLTKAQRETVLAIARKDPKLKGRLGTRAKVLFVRPNLTGRGKEHPGQAVLGIHDYRDGRSVVAVIDPEEKRVVGVEELPVPLQLGDEERDDANALAAKDKRIAEFLQNGKLNPLTRLYFPPGGGEPGHRYAIVFARPNNSERRYAIVDLTARKVTDVLDQLASRGPHTV